MLDEESSQQFKVNKAPAPWNLSGDGYVFIYKFTQSFLREQGFIPPFFQDKLALGLGAMIFVDYKSSNVGPYYELLFIPGLFSYKMWKYFSISKIFVSSVDSMVNGQTNWGIPKETAKFNIEAAGNKSQKVCLSTNGEEIINFTLKEGGFNLPFNNHFLPVPLIQYFNDKIFLSSLSGKSMIKSTELSNIKVNSKLFPDLTSLKPLLSLKVENFSLIIPRAKIHEC